LFVVKSVDATLLLPQRAIAGVDTLSLMMPIFFFFYALSARCGGLMPPPSLARRRDAVTLPPPFTIISRVDSPPDASAYATAAYAMLRHADGCF